MSEAILKKCKDTMQGKITHFEKELAKVRTGRASITLLDGVRVLYYGNLTPLNQVATLATPDAKTISIAPYEKSLLGEIEKSIMKADLGLQPNNDGNLIRVPIPPLTQERRKDLAKSLGKMAEDAKVALRLARRDANEEFKKQQKDKTISEDDFKRLEKEVQKITDKFVETVDQKTKAKETEIMSL